MIQFGECLLAKRNTSLKNERGVNMDNKKEFDIGIKLRNEFDINAVNFEGLMDLHALNRIPINDMVNEAIKDYVEKIQEEEVDRLIEGTIHNVYQDMTG